MCDPHNHQMKKAGYYDSGLQLKRTRVNQLVELRRYTIHLVYGHCSLLCRTIKDLDITA